MTAKRECPHQVILAGGNDHDRYENRVDNLRLQIKWAGRDDPWAKPDEQPPQLAIYLANTDIIEAERETFIDMMGIGGADLLQHTAIGEVPTYANYRVQAMWATWLAARLGFTGVFK